ncbi:MAG TPA: site-specific integrase [Candidatus Acidoferrales bacterium]|nr:site-specific integrase [Candidatus Acidoferrales bacterium]
MSTQQGNLFQSHGAWYVRFREQVQQTDGSIKWVQRAKRLASVADYPKKSEVIPLKNEEMARLNKVGFTVEAGVSIVDFVENVYFPTIERRLKPSTVRGYKDAWHCHIMDRVTAMRVRDFRTVDGENLMQQIGREHGRKLAHGTYKHIKVTLSAMFTEAKRKGLIDGVNPMQGVSIPKGKKHGRKRLTYSLPEIEQHLDLFRNDPILIVNEDGSAYAPAISVKVIRAVIGVAAFAGLREGEVRGLWWEDDELSVLNIRRSVWRSFVLDETKTHEDEEDPGVVPIIQPLRLMLDQIRPQAGSGWMFGNSIGGALDLDNLADRVIKPVLRANGLNWKGWHAYRRGLATNLHELGVPDKVIQAILRHEDVSTTQRSYIKTVPRVVSDAMRQLEEKIARAADVQQVSVN